MSPTLVRSGVLPLNSDDACFDAARVLAALRVSPSELGYRAQALFAATLERMSAGVDVIARAGHPDVLVRMRGRALRIQVKATGQHSFQLSREDLDGIRPRSDEEEGYLALLDVGPPVAWTCVPHGRARVLVGRTVPLAMLKTMGDVELSSRCTEIFAALMLEHRDSFEAFTFSLVRHRTLAKSPD